MKLPTPRYKRKGKCNNCGACCLHEDCEHLEFLDGKAICKIHPSIIGGELRPPKCPNFPQAPPILFELCGYYFVDLWEDNAVIIGLGV